MSFAMPIRNVLRIGSWKLSSASLMSDANSYWVWSMYPGFAHGEIIIVGTRKPSPYAST